ncbi:MAG: riboflavin synthase [Lysinibacillus sp.]
MFTGIIEELGTVKSIQPSQQAMHLAIRANKILQDVQLGDSISVNGVCVTVTSFDKDGFTADVMPETMKVTSLSKLQSGHTVNLERAMLAGGRFGGHIVSGHVDGIATIVKKQSVANAVYVQLEMQPQLTEQCIERGSITVDGISLTIFELTNTHVTVSIIPHTYKETVLGIKGIGDIVNIETDLIGKYVKKMMPQNSSKLGLDTLQRAGF